jgi:hypothetical protein
MPAATTPRPDPTTPTASAELDAFKALTRRVAFETARTHAYCDPGLNTTLSNLGLPPVQCITTLTATVEIHPAGLAEQDLFTRPASALVYVAVALRQCGHPDSRIAGPATVTRCVSTDDETPHGHRHPVQDQPALLTAVTAQVTIEIGQRITGITPTAADRDEATNYARRAIATITASVASDVYDFHATIIDVEKITVDDYSAF